MCRQLWQCKKLTVMALALKVSVVATVSIGGSVAEDIKTMPVRGHKVFACSQRQCKKLTAMALALKVSVIATVGIGGSVAEVLNW